MFSKKIECPNCKKMVKQKEQQCPFCHTDLTTNRETLATGGHWVAREDEIAARLNTKDLSKEIGNQLEVEPGTRAIIFEEGKSSGVVGAGSYTLDTFLSKLNRFGKSRDVTVIVTRENPFELAMEFPDGLVSKEFLDVDTKIQFAVSIDDPSLFLLNLLGTRTTYTVVDLKQLLYPYVQQTLKEYFVQHSIEALYQNGSLRTEMSAQLDQELNHLLDGYGLKVSAIQTLQVGHSQFDENNQLRAKAWIDADRDQVEREKRLRLDELYDEEELHKITRMESAQQRANLITEMEGRQAETDYTQRLRRIDLLERTIKADSRERALEQGAADEVHGLEQRLRERDQREAEEVLGWAQTKALAGIEREKEMAIARIEQEKSVGQARMVMEQDVKIQRLKQEYALAQEVETEENRRRQNRIDEEYQQANRKREEALRNAAFELEIQEKEELKQVQNAKGKIELQRIQDEYDWEAATKKGEMARDSAEKDAETAIKIARQQAEAEQVIAQGEIETDRERHRLASEIARDEEERKAQKRKRQAEHLREMGKISSEMDDADSKRKKEEQAQAHSQGIEKLKTEGDIELKRINAMGNLGPEALISLSDVQQATIIADLKKSESLKEMSADQILAMAAEKNPHVAEAFKERFRATQQDKLSDREREIYETMARDREMLVERMEGQSKRHEETVHAMFNKTTETLGNIANTQANALGQQQTVVAQPAQQPIQPQVAPPQPAPTPAPAAVKVKLCSNCNMENVATAKFCDNCATAL